MTFNFQTWMQAIWSSIVEPSDAARKVVASDFPREALWTGLALVAVLNVILLALLQLFTPAPVIDDTTISLSPFGYAGIVGTFMVLFVFTLQQTGRFFGGIGELNGTLAIVVWFQAISLTLEAVQLVLVLISPSIASLFGLLSLGALIWIFLNFINVLHGFQSLGKSALVVFLALLSTAFVAGLILSLFGIAPIGGTV